MANRIPPKRPTPSDEKVAQAVRGYETLVGDLCNAAGILTDRLEDSFGAPDAHESIVGKKHCYYLPPSELERTIYIAYSVLDQVQAFRQRYYADVYGDDDPVVGGAA